MRIEIDIEPEELTRLFPQAKVVEMAVVESLTTMQKILANQDARIDLLKETIDNLGIMLTEQKELQK